MIEFLPPREDAFGERDVADFVGVDGGDAGWDDDEPPRSRWLTAVATVGVLGLLVGGVVAAAPWSGDDQATPPTPPSTTPTSTTPATATTVDTSDDTLPEWMDDGIPGYVLPENVGLELGYAVSYPGQMWTGDVIDVWGTPDAARDAGTWLAVDSMSSDGDFLSLFPDATRIEVDDTTMLVRTDVDGVTHLVVDPPARTRFELVSRGIGLDRLLAVAAGVDAGRSRIKYDPGLVASDGSLEGLAFLTTTQLVTGYGMVGVMPSATASYLDRSDGTSVEVTLSQVDLAAQPVIDLLIGRPLDPVTLGPEAQAALEQLRDRGLDPEVRESTGAEGIDGGVHAVIWKSPDGSTVSVSGTGDLDELVVHAARATLAPAATWRDLVRRSAQGGLDVYDGGPTTVLADDRSEQWSAQVWGGWFGIYGPSYYTNVRFQPGNGPQLRVFRSLDQAFLLVTNTWPNEGLQVVVTQPGVAPAPAIQLVQIDDRPVYGTVVRLEPDVPHAVQWFDLEGAPVEGPVA